MDATGHGRQVKISSLDVAREAGVSPATVSLVLNGRMDISLAPTTRRRVREVAERLGYRPSQAARSLLTGRTKTIGVVLPSLASSFVAQIAEGIQAQAADQDYRILLAHTRHDPAFEARQLDLLLQHQVEGVAIISGEKTLAELPRRLMLLERSHVPCVVIDDSLCSDRVDCVVSDDRLGARQAVEHLIAAGHRRIAHLSAGNLTSSARDRFEGYRSALRSAGLPVSRARVAGGSYQSEAAREAIQQLTQPDRRVTAIFAANDRQLADALPLIRSRGLKVPEDLALVGYANYDFSSYLGLTTVEQHPTEMGRCAVSRLLERISNPTLKPKLLTQPVRLVVRDSCGTSAPAVAHR